MERASMRVLQKCQQSDINYSKAWFVKLITDNTTQEEFDRFCREIAHLNAYYDQTVGLRATDRPDKIWDNPLMFDLEEIDFDSPVTFKKIS